MAIADTTLFLSIIFNFRDSITYNYKECYTYSLILIITLFCLLVISIPRHCESATCLTSVTTSLFIFIIILQIVTSQ